jgi:transcriptional regulator with XRE-family HTH domain
MSLGKKIEERRTSLGLSREALAIRSKVGQKSVYNYEKDIRSPTIRDLQKIAFGLNTTMSWLLDGLDLKDKTPDLNDLPNEKEIVNQIFFLRHRPDIREPGLLRIMSMMLDKLSKESKVYRGKKK